MSELAEKRCVPCKGDTPTLKGGALKALLGKLDGGWNVVDEHHLTKTLRFENFADALSYVNRVGKIAETEQHHPDLYLAWGKVRIDIWTHKIGGLTESDFVFAAKADTVVGT